MSKSKICKRIIGVGILALLISCLSLKPALAITTRTETLDLISQETEDQLTEEGWSWNKETQTLILKDVNIETNDLAPCIKLPDGDVTIEFEGNNKLKAQRGTVLLSDLILILQFKVQMMAF